MTSKKPKKEFDEFLDQLEVIMTGIIKLYPTQIPKERKGMVKPLTSFTEHIRKTEIGRVRKALDKSRGIDPDIEKLHEEIRPALPLVRYYANELKKGKISIFEL